MDDELRPEDFDDVLATVGLYTDSVLLGDDRTQDREASVTFIRPLVYRLTGPTAPGAPVDLLLCFPFDLAPSPVVGRTPPCNWAWSWMT